MNAKTSAKLAQVKVLKNLAKQLESLGDTSEFYARRNRNDIGSAYINLGQLNQQQVKLYVAQSTHANEQSAGSAGIIG